MSYSGPELLDVYEQTEDDVAELEVDLAFALRVPGLAAAAQTHADAARYLLRMQASLGRTLLASN